MLRLHSAYFLIERLTLRQCPMLRQGFLLRTGGTPSAHVMRTPGPVQLPRHTTDQGRMALGEPGGKGHVNTVTTAGCRHGASPLICRSGLKDLAAVFAGVSFLIHMLMDSVRTRGPLGTTLQDEGDTGLNDRFRTE